MVPQIVHLMQRRRPHYGWLPFSLLVGILLCLIYSVLDAGWVEDDRVIVPAVAAGFVLTVWLARRSASGPQAWIILTVAGLALALIAAANLVPPIKTLQGGEQVLLQYWRSSWILFLDRVLGWWRAVRSGGSSSETVVFTLFLAMAGWYVAASLAWSTYRSRRPLIGISLAGLGLAANTFYGHAPIYWIVFFVGLAITAAAYLGYLYREEDWDRDGIDYSSEVRADLLVYAGGISLGLMALAISLPAIDFRAIAERFQEQEAVEAAEETLARAFAGVAPRPAGDEGAAGAGDLPRRFLLGGDPELTETIVMTAALSLDGGELTVSQPTLHWRSVSYDVYTGRGWDRSPEREEIIDREQPIHMPELASNPAGFTTISQEVSWIFDRRATRYTLGRPLSFSDGVATVWRGVDDLVGTRRLPNAPLTYHATSAISRATPDQLRAAQLADTPPEILARYTMLPDEVPARVHELARRVAGLSASAAPSPYDQALAIEQFLRQYPYTLDLPPPPGTGDIVDYFLFDLQRGFCDYYASAMVVMARSAGLPSRLAAGYLQGPSGGNGIQTIRQSDAHSWAEIYFAGYGWIEFEPTPAFPAANVAPPADPSTVSGPAGTPALPAEVAMPERAPLPAFPWALVLGIAAIGIIVARIAGRRITEALRDPYAGLDETQRAYAHLLRSAAAAGHPPRTTQTPAEFARELLQQPDLSDTAYPALQPSILSLARDFATHQYGTDTERRQTHARAVDAWARLRVPMRRLGWRRRLRRFR